MRWRARAGRALSAVACGLIALLVCTACGADAASGSGARFVTPPLIHHSSMLWPFPLQLVGVRPGVRLRLSASLDATAGRWRSAATYTVPASGILDLATAKPQFAAFTSPDSAGLFWSLQGPAIDPSELMTLWMRSKLLVRLEASDEGRVVATRYFTLDGLGTQTQPLALTSLAIWEAARQADERILPPVTVERDQVGAFYAVRSSPRLRHPAVILFDDPAVGASADYVIPLLAQFGASVVMISTRRDTSGVYSASTIESSRIAAVLDWLAQRPDIDERNIFTYGTSQSAQFALWAATRFTDRIKGVFAAGGAATMLCLRGASMSPVVENGARTPCQASAHTIDPTSVLPLELVTGPLVLACAEADEVLPNACSWVHAATVNRVGRPGDVILRAPGSVHAMTVPPGLPIALPAGPAAQPTEQARVAFWNAVGGVLLRASQQ